MENKNSNKFTFIDLFAGCGGLSLGLTKSGLQCRWAIEIDEDAVQTYKYNLGNHIICDDIKNVNIKQVPNVDLIVGGFPCQPFSISGLQDGFDGKDGDLFNQCVRFIDALKPKIFILENVAGFVNLKKGFFLNKAIEILNGLNYHTSWKILNTAEYGIPQERKRVFIMGNNLGIKNIYSKPNKKRVSVKEAIDDIWQNMDGYENNAPMRHTQRIIERFSEVRPGETARDAMDRNPKLGNAKITRQCYRRLYPDQPSATIVANFVTTTIHYSQNRNLTAREAARIQTFPDNFIFKGRRTRMSWQKGLSQFEQIGNAVPPEMGRLLGNCVKNMLNGSGQKLSKVNLIKKNKHIQKTFEVETKIDKKINNNKRGRKSKYASIYTQIENLNVGERIKINSNIDNNFYTFLEGAMRRRGIDYDVKKDNSGEVLIVRT